MTTKRIPRGEGEFNAWYANFRNNLASVAAQVGVTADEIARVDNDSPVYGYLILRNDVIRSYKDDESKVKDRAFNGDVHDAPPILPTLVLPKLPDGLTVNAGIEEYANLLVQRIVKHPGCTPAIEALLDIELKEAEGDEQLKGLIKEIKATMGAVVMKCSLQGYKSYRVFCQRGSDADFVAIGDSTQAEFADERPNLVAGQPEKRQYKIVLLEKNKPVGEFSAIETVVTQP